MKIAIYGSRRQHSAIAGIARFLDVLRGRGIAIAMHQKLLAHLAEIAPDIIGGVAEAATPAGADLVVSLGGDGTFLRSAVWVCDLEIPIVGVNTGHLGFLSAMSLEELPHLPELIENDRFRLESRTLLCLSQPQMPDFVGRYALNDISITKEESASMISAAVSLDGIFLADYRADGLIICTSTGSTAYSMSVGGPIVQPTVDVNVISPVAAHSLSMRPLVVDGRSRISIVPQGRSSQVRVALDGRSAPVDMGTEIVISRAPFCVKVLQKADHSFADTLRSKLHWGEQ